MAEVHVKYGKFVKNIPDPRAAEACDTHRYSYRARSLGYQCRRQEWQEHLAWVATLVIGPPRATGRRTSRSLTDAGLVGLYAAPEAPKVTQEQQRLSPERQAAIAAALRGSGGPRAVGLS